MGYQYGFLEEEYYTPTGSAFSLHYPMSIGNTNNHVTALTFDSCGYLWYGTNGGGFGFYTGDYASSNSYLLNNSQLPSDVILSIASEGNIILYF